jgi:hypothetical protein
VFCFVLSTLSHTYVPLVINQTDPYESCGVTRCGGVHALPQLIVAAQALESSGLLAAGYDHVTIDDWYATRDATGKIIALPETVPSGMDPVAETSHEAVDKFGVYSAVSQGAHH